MRVPKSINEPRYVFFSLQLDVVIIFLAVFSLVSIVLSLATVILPAALAVGVFVAIIAIKIYAKIVKEAPPGYLPHMMYEIFGSRSVQKNKDVITLPEPHETEYFE